jgi:hypothetical protein
MTITNTGDARLDFTAPSGGAFTISACMSGGTAVSSLPPGGKCVLTVAPVLVPPTTGSVTEFETFDDSAPGAPHSLQLKMFVVSATAAPPPTCSIAGIRDPGLLPRFVLTVSDKSSGLQSVNFLTTPVNAIVGIPGFSAGTTNPVTITAWAEDPSLPASAEVLATNVAGVSTNCGSSISPAPPQWTSFGGSLISNVAAGENPDTRVEVFGIGSDKGLWHVAQTAPNGSWAQWSSLGGTGLTGDPVVGVDQDGRLEVFVISDDHSLWNIAQIVPGSWSQSSWQKIGSGVTGRPAVILNSNGNLEVFARGVDRELLLFAQSAAGLSTSYAMTPFGGVITSNPTAVRDANGG